MQKNVWEGAKDVELVERVRNLLRAELGIESDAEVLEAYENQEMVDLGIFLVPIAPNREERRKCVRAV